jgi:hypothetical protein
MSVMKKSTATKNLSREGRETAMSVQSQEGQMIVVFVARRRQRREALALFYRHFECRLAAGRPRMG